ncbi:PQQ-dependent sugar dehydrogenase [Aestuariicoccus sp. KMU-90]|uniref:PQQ-dependent sugar dehydrogenase n=2 Tax=Thetidibacter halocola TaxID=2827239 RepID=A0A8J7W9R1_9RHOB|nr:PQQ-dependent sugar dehydrogenase [Thetidibacter halocola]MBS0122549.1 PQQ-dependent sugar dehydrogenase [Thetidibacter halocola]
MVAQPVVEGLDIPWAFGFLPDGTILVTEREGALVAQRGEDRWTIDGLPKIEVDGQGGLLDILVPRDFATSREIFLTYSKAQFVRGSGTAVYRARLSEDGRRLEGGETIFEIARGSGGGFHFGSRIVEASDGTLFVTVGDRGNPETAQDRAMHNGSVLRITRDGRVPADNPFVGQSGVQPEIWSWGHRNPQGAAVDGDGQLWVIEHGARGGDEVNRIEKGANYGWPVIAYGVNYNGSSIGVGTAQEGMKQPVYYWDPSIAPSDMAFFRGGNWDGQAFVGSLKFDYVSRLSGNPLREVERIEGAATSRVRDVDQGPDGALWFLSEGNGALYRLVPGEGS